MIKLLALLGIARLHRAKSIENDEQETLEFYQRLNSVVTRARVVSIEGNRFASAMGPDGPLPDETVRAMVRLGERVANDAR